LRIEVAGGGYPHLTQPPAATSSRHRTHASPDGSTATGGRTWTRDGSIPASSTSSARTASARAAPRSCSWAGSTGCTATSADAMRAIKKFLSHLLSNRISISLTRWFEFVFESNTWTPESYFYVTFFGIGLRIPFADFRFRIMNDGHRNASFNPVLQAWIAVWKFDLRTEEWNTSEIISPQDWEAGIYYPEEKIRRRTGVTARWKAKKLFTWIPFKSKKETV